MYVWGRCPAHTDPQIHLLWPYGRRPVDRDAAITHAHDEDVYLVLVDASIWSYDTTRQACRPTCGGTKRTPAAGGASSRSR